MRTHFVSQLSLKRMAAVCLLAIGASQSQAQQVITIQQAIENTLKNNLQIKQATFSESLSDVNLQQSRLALLPSVNANANQSLGWGRNQVASGLYQNTKNLSISGGISAGIELFGGFAKLNQIRQNKTLLDAAKSNIDKIKNDLTLSVITNYMQILFAKDILNAAKEQSKIAKLQVEQLEHQVAAGTKTTADLSQAKSQLASADATVENNKNTLTMSYLALSQLMEMPSNSSYEVQAPLIDGLKISGKGYQAQDVYETALQSLPEIKYAAQNTKAAEIGVKLARANFYPRLSFSASLGSSYFNSANPFITNASFEQQIKSNVSKGIGLSLSIPIFNGLQAGYGVKRAKINLLQSQGQELVAKNNLNKIIYQAVEDARGAEAKYHSAQSVMAAQKDAFFAIEQRYHVGLANAVEFNTALTNRNKAELDWIQSKYEALLKIKIIDFYLGKDINF